MAQKTVNEVRDEIYWHMDEIKKHFIKCEVTVYVNNQLDDPKADADMVCTSEPDVHAMVKRLKTFIEKKEPKSLKKKAGCK